METFPPTGLTTNIPNFSLHPGSLSTLIHWLTDTVYKFRQLAPSKEQTLANQMGPSMTWLSSLLPFREGAIHNPFKNGTALLKRPQELEPPS